MSVRLLTTDQHQDVLRRLIDLARSIKGTKAHHEGWEFTSLHAAARPGLHTIARLARGRVSS